MRPTAAISDSIKDIQMPEENHVAGHLIHWTSVGEVENRSAKPSTKVNLLSRFNQNSNSPLAFLIE